MRSKDRLHAKLSVPLNIEDENEKYPGEHASMTSNLRRKEVRV